MAILVGRRAAPFLHFDASTVRPVAAALLSKNSRAPLGFSFRLLRTCIPLRATRPGLSGRLAARTRPNESIHGPCRLRCATTTALGVPSPALHPAQRSKRVQAWIPEVPRCPCLQALSICSGTTLQIRSCTDATPPLPASVGACIDRALLSMCPSKAMGEDTAVS